MKTVIFVGSGFSKALFNQKIQGDLLKDFLNSPESNSYISFLSDDLVNLMSATDDIEVIMSHYLNLAYSGLPHEKKHSKYHQRTIIFFRMALAIYFRDKFLNSGYRHYQEESQYLIEEYFRVGFIRENELTLITTNYDLGLEKIIEDLFGVGSYYYPGFEERPESGIAIPIIKLHGSINWLEDRGNIDDPGFKNATRKGIQKEILDQLTVQPLPNPNEFSLQVEGVKYTPIMVPFFHQKMMWHQINKHWWGNAMDKNWEMSYNKIVNAEKVLFWGYSLPSADYHMFSFLLKAMTSSNGDCEIVDFSSNEVEEESNLRKMISHIYREKDQYLSCYEDGLIDYLMYYNET